jgi:lysyl-tRNA synthetase class 2
MRTLEELIEAAAQALNNATQVKRQKRSIDLRAPFERLTCQEAFERFAGFDPLPLDAQALSQAARTVGVRPAADASWDDLFTQLLMEKVEPCLGLSQPTFLTHYPASQAALARLSTDDPRVAERFELYAGGLELANGFSELCDAREQRARLTEEQELRRSLGREVFPLDERFLEALPRISSAGGVAVGLDRLLMLLVGAQAIADVLLFPAAEEYGAART